MNDDETDYNELPAATRADLAHAGATVILLVPVTVPGEHAGPVVVEEMRMPLSVLREWLKSDA